MKSIYWMIHINCWLNANLWYIYISWLSWCDGVSDKKISKAWKCNITSRNEQISLIEYIISEDIAIDLDDMRMGWQFFQKILIIPVNHILKIYRDLAEKLRKIWNLGPASYLASAHKDSSEGASANKKKLSSMFLAQS